MKIYRDMQNTLQSSQQQLKQANENLQTSQRKLSDINKEITNLNNEINTNKQQIKSQRDALFQAQAELKLKNTEVENKNSELNNILQQRTSLEENVKNLSQNLEEKQQALNSQQTSFEKLRTDVANSQKILANLETQISEKNTILSTQSAELGQQQEQIEKQQKTVLTTLIILATTILAMVFISVLFVKNKRINRELNQANKNLKLTQNQLVESEKFAALGQLVAGVAHELNTPIGIAITSASFINEEAQKLQNKLNDSKLKKTDLASFLSNLNEAEQIATKNLNRCAEMIQSFKLVSADQTVAEVRKIDLLTYVQEVISTLAVSLKRKHINWKILGEPIEIRLDPGILSQVINNIVMNAINHAFNDKEDKNLSISISQSQKHANIVFKDDGCGMDQTTLSQLFDPFFTTKRGEGGTGLGMNIVYNLVVQNLKGNIEAESTINKGTVIKISIPTTFIS